MLLAIDTSAGTSVAVVDLHGGILAERQSDDPRLHAEVIGTLLDDCLRASGVARDELSAIAAGMGPGPFTGLRVGIAAAQAFALGVRKPVVRVVSHDAIAAASYEKGAEGGMLVVTDARRRELYWSTYSGLDDGGLPKRVGEPGLTRPENLADAVPGVHGYTRIDAVTVSAGALGMVAERMHAAGRTFAGIHPLYLRSPDVTLSAGPKRVTG
ncbi:MAG: hypothetical protein RI885_79 [Actinomycetota bacterium]|jgi:tRNA threonylcarbamoyl adenosine modification protein YeaZ